MSKRSVLLTNGSLLIAALLRGLFAGGTITSADREPVEQPAALPGTQSQIAPVHTCPGRMPLSRKDEARGPLRVGPSEGVTQPSRTVYVRPVYPDRAKAQEVKGVVILEVLLDKEGIVRSTQILRSIPLLDQAAADAACRWRYTPALLNGIPTATALTVTVSFPPRQSAPERSPKPLKKSGL